MVSVDERRMGGPGNRFISEIAAVLALREAFLAVDRPFTARLERDLAFFIAIRADRFVHGPFSVIIILPWFGLALRLVETL